MRRHPLTLGAAALGLALTLTACGEEGSSGTSAPEPAGTGNGGQATSCEPVPGDELVVLQDDQNLQTVDNIIPVVNAEAAAEPLLEALNKVSAAMTTDELIELNRAVLVERQTSPNVAADYVETEGLAEGLSGGSGTVVVGAANFAENETLANIYAVVLDAAGYDASVQTIGAREVYEPALERGEIQVVPEYVGTLTEFLNKKQNGPDAEARASSDLEETTAALEELAGQVGLVVGEPSEAQDQNAFAVTKGFAEEYEVTSLTELAEACGGGDLLLGGPPECPERPFCQPGLESTYGIEFEEFVPLDAGGPLTKTALQQGRIDVGLVFSSDGSLSTLG